MKYIDFASNPFQTRASSSRGSRYEPSRFSLNGDQIQARSSPSTSSTANNNNNNNKIDFGREEASNNKEIDDPNTIGQRRARVIAISDETGQAGK